jgi:uncharacterized delta-60 repeat protein
MEMAMRKPILVATVLVVAQIPVFALVLSQERTWGGPLEDVGEDVAVAADGSVYVTGTTDSFGAGGRDAFLLKYAADGSLEWQRTYGTTPSLVTGGQDFGLGVAIGSDQSVYITGGFGSGNLFLVKFDPDGNVVWQRTWGGNGVSGSDVAVAADGSVYVAGVTFLSGQGQADALLVKFTPAGDVVWAQTWGGQFFDGAEGVAIGSDGGIYIAGDSNSFGDEFAFLVKFAADGSMVWDRAWGVGGDAFAFAVSASPDGSVYMTGLSAFTSTDLSVFLAKFDAAGALLWDKLSGPDFGTGLGVTVGLNGNVYVTGSAPDATRFSDAFVVEFLPNGRARTARMWGGAEEEDGRSIAAAPDGSIVVAGLASAPPYASTRAAHRTLKPASVLQVPAGVVAAAAGEVGSPLGVVTIPLGSETFAGALDAAWFRLLP